MRYYLVFFTLTGLAAAAPDTAFTVFGNHHAHHAPAHHAPAPVYHQQPAAPYHHAPTPAYGHHASAYSQQVDADYYANLALNTPLVKESGIKAARDSTSPNAAAALAFMKAHSDDGDVCYKTIKVYLENILEGSTAEKANSEATRLFINEYNAGRGPIYGSPCQAATDAWQKAEYEYKDPVVASALAFMEAFPAAKEGSPCAISAVDYVKAILNGKSHTEANFASVTSFANALIAKASRGEQLKDKACAESTKAYFAALPEKPSPPNAAAMIAFIEKAFDSDKFDYDPICWKSTEAFFKSYVSGNTELNSNLAAAEEFLAEFAEGSKIPADSPCAAATRAYYANIPNPPSGPNKAAMEAFMNKMIGDGPRQPDPVCAASTTAFWKAYRDGESETSANLKAARAFFTSFNSGLAIPADSPCVAATRAYALALPDKPSGPNSDAMIAFIDHMIANGGKRVFDPVCAASSVAFFDAHVNGDDELTANLKAAKAFFNEYKKGATVPADSPCAAATKIYFDSLKNKPSSPNALAMLTFIDESVKTGNNQLDPVCAASAEAFFDAYLAGFSEAQANEMASHAFLEAVANTPSFTPGSPCGKAADIYMKSFGL